MTHEIEWLTRYGPEGPSSRYRAFQFEHGLEELGWISRFEPLARRDLGRREQAAGVVRRALRLAARAEPGARDADVVVVQKEPIMPPVLYPPLRRRWHRQPTPVVWDIDDAVWIGRRGAASMALDMCRRAAVVVAGNDLLAEWAGRTADRVETVPPCFEPASPVRRTPVDSDAVRMVWIGSPATSPLLRPFGALLAGLLAACSSLEVSFIGGEPPPELVGHPRVERRAWSVETETAALSRADYGLALQPRTPYADHKCGFKVVQYLAFGVVPIATDNPVHRSLLGPHGLLVDAATPRDVWIDRVGERPAATESSAIRARWADNFSRARALEAWARILEGTASFSRGGG